MKLEANGITIEGPFELDGLYYDAVRIKSGDCSVVVPWSVLAAFFRHGIEQGRFIEVVEWLASQKTN